MPFSVATLQELIDQAEAEIAARLGTGPLARRSVLRVVARVMAGLAKSGHGHLEYLARQILPDQAEAEYLERHASIRGLSRKAATFATGSVTISGTPGSSFPAGARLQRSDGTLYETTAAITIPAGGSTTAAVTAEQPGEGGNAIVGTQLTTQAAFAGIQSAATAATALEGGTDAETDEALRERVLRAWRERPQAGTAEDYERWALEVPGITRAWARGNTPQLGAVTIYVVGDENEPTIAPTAAQLTEVEGLIATRRPITSRPAVVAPTLQPLDLTLSVSPSSDAVKSAVSAALADRIRLDAAPGGTLRLSRLREAISTAPGEVYHSLTLPATDPVAEPDELFVLGTVTWS